MNSVWALAACRWLACVALLAALPAAHAGTIPPSPVAVAALYAASAGSAPHWLSIHAVGNATLVCIELDAVGTHTVQLQVSGSPTWGACDQASVRCATLAGTAASSGTLCAVPSSPILPLRGPDSAIGAFVHVRTPAWLEPAAGVLGISASTTQAQPSLALPGQPVDLVQYAAKIRPLTAAVPMLARALPLMLTSTSSGLILSMQWSVALQTPWQLVLMETGDVLDTAWGSRLGSPQTVLATQDQAHAWDHGQYLHMALPESVTPLQVIGRAVALYTGGGPSMPLAAGVISHDTESAGASADCELGDWAAYQACQCAASSGAQVGTQLRERQVVAPPYGVGLPCPGLREVRPCTCGEPQPSHAASSEAIVSEQELAAHAAGVSVTEPPADAHAVAWLRSTPSASTNIGGWLALTFSPGMEAESRSPSMHITYDIFGLTAGPHGIHVHAYGDLGAQPDASAPGGHFLGSCAACRPDGALQEAGLIGDGAPIVSTDGRAAGSFDDLVITLAGQNGVAGRSIVVHGDGDASGKRVAFGVIALTSAGSQVLEALPAGAAPATSEAVCRLPSTTGSTVSGTIQLAQTSAGLAITWELLSAVRGTLGAWVTHADTLQSNALWSGSCGAGQLCRPQHAASQSAGALLDVARLNMSRCVNPSVQPMAHSVVGGYKIDEEVGHELPPHIQAETLRAPLYTHGTDEWACVELYSTAGGAARGGSDSCIKAYSDVSLMVCPDDSGPAQQARFLGMGTDPLLSLAGKNAVLGRTIKLQQGLLGRTVASCVIGVAKPVAASATPARTMADASTATVNATGTAAAAAAAAAAGDATEEPSEHCKLSGWTPWSPCICQSLAYNGSHVRARGITQLPRAGGSPCAHIMELSPCECPSTAIFTPVVAAAVAVVATAMACCVFGILLVANRKFRCGRSADDEHTETPGNATPYEPPADLATPLTAGKQAHAAGSDCSTPITSAPAPASTLPAASPPESAGAAAAAPAAIPVVVARPRESPPVPARAMHSRTASLDLIRSATITASSQAETPPTATPPPVVATQVAVPRAPPPAVPRSRSPGNPFRTTASTADEDQALLPRARSPGNPFGGASMLRSSTPSRRSRVPRKPA